MQSYYSLIILFFILAGIAAAIFNGRRIIQSNKTKNWPHISATIVHKSAINEKATPEIFYRYQISETIYEKKIEPTPGEETMPGFVAHFKNKYPDGDKTNIFYNPDSPENARLTVGPTPEDKLIFSISIGAILLGLYAITVSN